MKKQMKADLMLLLITVFWGASYMLTKLGLGNLQPFNLTALRFIIAFVLSAVVFHKQVFSADKKTIKYSLILGMLLVGMFISMTYGLQYTTASNAGFLISLSVVLIPIISYLFLKQNIEKRIILSICLVVIGIALLTLDTQFRINVGDLLCILCALFCAVHVVVLGIYTKEVDSVALGILQLGFAGFFCIIISVLTENMKFPDTPISWLSVLMLSIFCTAVGYIVQSTAQQYTTAIHTGLILSLEPVFSAILSNIFLNETLAPRGYAGAFLMLISVLNAELDLKSVFQRKAKERSMLP
ncbi:DMT family transporter [Lutispora thermophila]|uniref:Permease of the drug/metabolite transporter (DMT) superfamily n=1 Tax=Lutispora thermophila DSM 19022 TaxID=1122184 RepID=A0A1M6BA37_9FIRM|nr:DMT family transporter [Lutispora thermophila]SHI45601.1 Permease of the drug/metabolite transporter (DMT) superfamily [Lutispora thermophila DSM 19022]